MTNEDTLLPYPNTCDSCPFRGEVSIVGDFIPLRAKEGPLEGQYEWLSVGWPVRCKKCNARAQARKRAKNSIARMEEIRDMTETAMTALDEAGADRWLYLKFVTLTWKNESVPESEPDMKSARKWLAKTRKKIAGDLDAIAGTDVLECVTTKVSEFLYHHHIHSHGVWVMPQHKIKKIESVMREHGIGRDQVRACNGKWITPKFFINDEWVPTGEPRYWLKPLTRASIYLSKYLTKEEGSRRGSWGLVRGSPKAEEFYKSWNKIAHLADL